MLNILINWLGDHTLWQQSCRTHVSQRRSITTPTRSPCRLSLMSSSPFSFSTSFHWLVLFRRWNDRQYPCLTCHTRLSRGRRSWAPQMDRHPICRTRCSPLTWWIWVVSAGIEINRSSCPQRIRAWLLLDGRFLRGDNSSVGPPMKERTAGGRTTSYPARRCQF